LRGCRIDDQLEIHGLFDRQVRRLHTSQNFVNVRGAAR
jgi:hypothetical protein